MIPPPPMLECDHCLFKGTIDEFPVVNEQYTCPSCGHDESALVLYQNGAIAKLTEAKYGG